jgi:hypothetical protein
VKLTVEVLKDLANQCKMPCVVFEFPGSNNKYVLEYDESKIINFHCGSNIILFNNEYNVHFATITELHNMFEEAYQGFHLEAENFKDDQWVFAVKKNDIESLKISDDYKLATEKMAEVKELRKLTEEALDIQKESASRINDLFKKLKDIQDYAKNLQLKEENEKKISEQLDNINSDIKGLETRLKKDIPELDKSLDINNFR